MREQGLALRLGSRENPEDLASTKLCDLGVIPEPFFVRKKGELKLRVLKWALDNGHAKAVWDYDDPSRSHVCTGHTVYYKSPTKALKRSLDNLLEPVRCLLLK